MAIENVLFRLFLLLLISINLISYGHRQRFLRARGAEAPLNFQVVLFYIFLFCLLKHCCQPIEPDLRCSKTGVVGGGGGDMTKDNEVQI